MFGRKRTPAPDASSEPAARADAEDAVEAGAPAERPDEPDLWSRILRAVSAVGPPVTIGAALLLYFGWARTDAQAKAMGLDVSLFGYTPQDYMLRSINSLFVPLAMLAVVAIVWHAIDRRLRTLLDAGRFVRGIRATAIAVTAVGAGSATVLAVVTLAAPGAPVPWRPYWIALGVLLAAWGIRLHRHARRAAGAERSSERHLAQATLVTVLVTLLLFWGTADFAQAVGVRLAAGYEAGVGSLPRTTVYSPDALSISAPGITETAVGDDDTPLYRYTGLRLLVVSGGRLFFLHDGWTMGEGRVIVMPDDEALTFEFQN